MLNDGLDRGLSTTIDAPLGCSNEVSMTYQALALNARLDAMLGLALALARRSTLLDATQLLTFDPSPFVLLRARPRMQVST